jgi:DNA polymerase-1
VTGLFPEAAERATGAAAAPPSRRVFLVDGTALAYRSYFAFIRNPLINSRGENTSGVFGFTSALLRLLEKESPEVLAVVFDPPTPTFRHEKFAEYKATREKMPEEMRGQIAVMKEVADALGIPVLEVDRYEADDVIGTLARRAAAEGADVYLVTPDKDFLQLVGGRIRIYDITKKAGEAEVLGPKEVEARFGAPPERVVDVLALMGDASDNVPGVPGVGEKTARDLVTTFGSVEDVLARAEEVKKKSVRESLLANRETALLSKDLVTIDTAAPVAATLDDLRRKERDRSRLFSLFERLEFRTLLKEVEADAPKDEHRYEMVASDAALAALVARLEKADRFVLDTETTGLDPLRAELVGLSFSFLPREAFYVPLNLPGEPFRGGARGVLDALRKALSDPKKAKVGQNAKYDVLALSTAGVEVRGLAFDTMIASYLIDPSLRQHNLDFLALKYLEFKKIPTSDLIGTGAKQITMREVPPERVSEYACEDADVTLRLEAILSQRLESMGLGPLFREVEMPLVDVLVDMERTGVKVDVAALEAMGRDLGERLERLAREVQDDAGVAFNLASPQQVASVLFEKLEIQKASGPGGRRLKRTKTGFSTDVEALERFSDHPIVAKILLHRQLSKLKGTYVDALPGLVNPRTGRVHTSFNQAVAATGRLSSSDPNLQNIPTRSEVGREIRKAFVPGEPGWLVMSADYSQIELRLLAHLSGDEALARAFREKQDVHRLTASRVFGVLPEMVTDDMRAQAKVINFGLIYGMGAQRLAAENKIDLKTAQEFIAAYFRSYPGIQQWLQATVEKARAEGAVETLLKRRRAVPEIRSDDPRAVAQAERIAINTPVQGTAADLIKKAMIAVHARLRREKLAARMLLQVHDELIFEFPEAERAPLEKLVVEEMEGALALSVPIVVNVSVGRSWFEAS